MFLFKIGHYDVKLFSITQVIEFIAYILYISFEEGNKWNGCGHDTKEYKTY